MAGIVLAAHLSVACGGAEGTVSIINSAPAERGLVVESGARQQRATLRVRNDRSEPVTLDRIALSCACAKAEPSAWTIGPGRWIDVGVDIVLKDGPETPVYVTLHFKEANVASSQVLLIARRGDAVQATWSPPFDDLTYPGAVSEGETLTIRRTLIVRQASGLGRTLGHIESVATKWSDDRIAVHADGPAVSGGGEEIQIPVSFTLSATGQRTYGPGQLECSVDIDGQRHIIRKEFLVRRRPALRAELTAVSEGASGVSRQMVVRVRSLPGTSPHNIRVLGKPAWLEVVTSETVAPEVLEVLFRVVPLEDHVGSLPLGTVEVGEEGSDWNRVSLSTSRK